MTGDQAIPYGQIIHPDDRRYAHDQVDTALRRSDHFEMEYRIIAKDGTEKWVWERGAGLQCDNEKHRLLEGFISDITERRRAAAEKEKLQSQLNQAQKMESVGRLAGGVAHDFNNMLGVILGYTEMALEHTGSVQPLFDDLQEIRKAAERSADLTRQLLTFARKQTIAPRIIDLNETVEGTLKMLRRLIGEDIDLAWWPGKNLAPVKMDPSQIDQILANLCVNARDAIAGVGKLTIETDIKRLFMSGYSANVIAHQGVLDEGVHFIQKPFSSKDLGVKLRELLEDKNAD